MSAATITQSATSNDDWQLVSSKWQDAINLLKEVPASSPNYAVAQLKIQEYGRNLDYARQRLDLPPLTQPEEVAALASLPLSNTSTEPASSPAISQATAVATPVPHPAQVMPTLSTEVAPVSDPDKSYYPAGIISLSILTLIVGIGLYKASIFAKGIIKILSDPSTDNSKTKPYIQRPLPAQPKTMKVSEFHLPEVVGRVGSIALGLGALVAFGLLNQKMGGGAVRVSGHRRSNGTYVHSYSRHRPR